MDFSLPFRYGDMLRDGPQKVAQRCALASIANIPHTKSVKRDEPSANLVQGIGVPETWLPVPVPAFASGTCRSHASRPPA